jgi:hypothetical protein
MADGDEGKAADGEEARRRALRPRTTLDLAATDLSAAPDDAAPPAGDAPPAAGEAPVSPPPQRSSRWPGHVIAALAGAVIAVVVIYTLAQSGNLPRANGSGDHAMTALDGRIAALEQRLAAAPATPADARAGLEKLQATVATLSGQVDRLTQELKANQAALAAKAPADAVAKLAQQVGAAGSGAASGADLGKRLDQADAALAGKASTADLAKLAQQVAAVQALLKTLDAGNPGRAATEARAAATLASIAALDGALARGAPFADTLADVQRLAGSADLSPLQRYAAKGAPRLDALASRLAADLAAAPAAPPPANASFLERLYASLRGLVRVTPAAPGGEPTGSGAAAERQRVIARLDRGDYQGAITAWNGLDPAVRKATADAETALAARLEADRRLNEIGRCALAALAGAADAAR